VASTEDQLKELQRSVSRAKAIGMDVEVISPDEALRIMPQLSKEHLYGAIYLPRGWPAGSLSNYHQHGALAREMGVEVNTNVRVTGIELSSKGEIQRVLTNKGAIRTEIVVNAAGLVGTPGGGDGRSVHADYAGGPPAHSLKAVSSHEFPSTTPCLRDPDNLVYMRQEAGGLVIVDTNRIRWHVGLTACLGAWRHDPACRL